MLQQSIQTMDACIQNTCILLTHLFLFFYSPKNTYCFSFVGCQGTLSRIPPEYPPEECCRRGGLSYYTAANRDKCNEW